MKKVICWFRNDLRIHDNPALYNAAKEAKILPIYILDDKNTGDYQIGDASKVWLHHSLISLNQKLKGNLLLHKGDPLEIIVKLVRSDGIDIAN